MNLEKVFTAINVTGTWLNLHPHYNLENRKARTCIFCKFSVIIKITCLLVVHVISLNGRLEFWHRKGSLILNVLSVCLFVFEGAITILLLWMSTFGNMKEWEKVLSLVANQIYNKNSMKKFTLLFLLGQCFSIIIIIINGWTWVNTVGFITYKHHLVRDVVMYHNDAFFFFYINLVLIVKNDLKKVNNLLSHIVVGTKIEQTVIKRHVSSIKLENLKVTDIAELAKTYRSIYEATKSINNIFGWKILFFIGYATCVLLKVLYTSIRFLNQNAIRDNYVTAVHFMNALMAMSITVRNI